MVWSFVGVRKRWLGGWLVGCVGWWVGELVAFVVIGMIVAAQEAVLVATRRIITEVLICICPSHLLANARSFVNRRLRFARL